MRTIIVGKACNIPTKIQTKVVVKEEREEGYYRDGPEDPEGAEGSTAKDCNSTDNSCAEISDRTTNTSTIVTINSMFPALFDANFRDKQLANV